MPDRIHQRQPALPWAAITFGIGFCAHGLDHLRRGMSACPAAIVVGFASALGFGYAHVLPTFAPGYQDSFVSPPHINVTWFSWLTAAAEIGAAIIFAIVGMREVRNAGNTVLRRSLRDVHAVG